MRAAVAALLLAATALAGATAAAILDVDFVYAGVQHSLRFHWLMNESKGRGTDMTHTYSPGRGLVHLDGNE